MAILKAISSKSKSGASAKSLEDYLNKEKSFKSGVDCDCDNWNDDFRLTKSIFDKMEGRQYLHFTQSFEKDCNLSEKQVNKAGVELVQMCKQFKGFQAVVITHTDKEHLHNHIVINSVSSENGKKIQFSSSNLKTLKNNMENYLKQEYGIEPTEAKKGIVKTQDTKTYKVLEKALNNEYESFTMNLAIDIKKSLDESTTQEDLKANLEKKDIKMDISESHNTIMFVDKNKKKVSSKKLKEIFGIDFDKESIEKKLEYNLKIKEMSNPKGFYEIKNEKPVKVKLDKFETYDERTERLKNESERKYELEKQEKASKKLKEQEEPSKIRVIQRATRNKDRGMER